MGNNKEFLTYRVSGPGRLLQWGGEIKTRVSERSNIYQGNPEIVPDIMRYIFPDVDFSKLEPKQVHSLLISTNKRLKTLDFSFFNDPITTKTVSEALSMAARTSHFLAIGQTKKVIVDILNKTKEQLPNENLYIIDIGYGPGTLSMLPYDLAQKMGLRPFLTGIDLSPVHQAIAKYLYPSSNYNVDWTNGNGTDFNPQFENRFDIGIAFDIGHHLSDDNYCALIENLGKYSTKEFLITDPTNYKWARSAVGLITRNDEIHNQSKDSYTAARSNVDQVNLFGGIMKNNQGQFETDITNTGFMNIIRIRRIRHSV